MPKTRTLTTAVQNLRPGDYIVSAWPSPLVGTVKSMFTIQAIGDLRVWEVITSAGTETMYDTDRVKIERTYA